MSFTRMTVRKVLLVCAVAVFSPVAIFAIDGSPHDVRIGFMIHNFTNPGVSLGFDLSVKEWEHSEIYVPLNLAFYLHPKNTRVIYLNAGIGYRAHSRGVFFLAGSVCLGYMHSFVDGDLYARSGEAIVRVPDSGQPGLMPYMDLRLGIDLPEGRADRFAPYFQVMTFGQYPYNGYILPHFGFQLGTSFYLKSSE